MNIRLLFALCLSVFLAMSVTACSDDDDDSGGNNGANNGANNGGTNNGGTNNGGTNNGGTNNGGTNNGASGCADACAAIVICIPEASLEECTVGCDADPDRDQIVSCILAANGDCAAHVACGPSGNNGGNNGANNGGNNGAGMLTGCADSCVFVVSCVEELAGPGQLSQEECVEACESDENQDAIIACLNEADGNCTDGLACIPD